MKKPPYSPEEHANALEAYEKKFGEPEVGVIEVGPDEYVRLMLEAIDKGEPIKRLDYFPEDAVT